MPITPVTAVQVINTNLDEVYIRQSSFIVNTEIITSPVIEAYSIGDLVNNASSSILPNLDFSSFGTGIANKNVVIESITVKSNNGGAYALTPLFTFYNSDNLTGSVLIDNNFFNPSYTESILKEICIIEPLQTVIPVGNLIYNIMQNELIRIGKLDTNGKLYFAMVSTKYYLPIASEHFYITIKGYLE
jgi:hypothetical protein